MDQQTRDFLAFRSMITPAIIQVIFWILVAMVVIAGVVGILVGLVTMFTQSFMVGLGLMLTNLVGIVLMPIIIRIYCELIILFFRMNETLTDIRNAKAGPPTEPVV